MRVFVTGATGFIGSAVVKELIAAGHQVLGLCSFGRQGARPWPQRAQRCIADPSRTWTASGAGRPTGRRHPPAFDHDFSKFVANCEDDRQVIGALGSVLAGSDRPLIVTSGTAIANTVPGRPAEEDNAIIGSACIPAQPRKRRPQLSPRDGVNVSIVRLPQVHDHRLHGFIPPPDRVSVKRACAPMSETDSIAGRRRIFSTWRASTGWRSKRRNEGKVSRGRGRGRAVGDIAEAIGRRLNCRSLHRPRKRPSLLAGSPCLPGRHARLQRANAEETGMAADRARADRRYRSPGLFRSVARCLDRHFRDVRFDRGLDGLPRAPTRLPGSRNRPRSRWLRVAFVHRWCACRRSMTGTNRPSS